MVYHPSVYFWDFIRGCALTLVGGYALMALPLYLIVYCARHFHGY